MPKYILQPYTTPASRHHCPNCDDRRKTFKRYVDTETGQPVADKVGRCDREQKCGYHYTPWQYFESQGMGRRVSGAAWNKRKARPKPRPKAGEPKAAQNFLCITPEIVNRTTRKYRQNHFVQYLAKRFGVEMAGKLVCHYYIGTAKHWPGATIFWQVDGLQNIRTGKVMLYDKYTGKRVKEPFSHITWAHSLLNKNKSEIENSKSEISQCLFGEHLLTLHPDMPVALVESEKTAIIASAYDRSCIWLATGGISNLNPQLCRVLRGRNITLYPDLGAYDAWKAKARLLQSKIAHTIFKVSDVLELNATAADREHGLDISDFL